MSVNRADNYIFIKPNEQYEIRSYVQNGVDNPLLSFKTSDNISETTQSYQEYEIVDTTSLRQDLEKTKSEQGFFGKLWDGFKNITGIGAGSSKAEQAIEDYENGLITEEEMQNAINGYKEGQKMAVDVVADMASGMVSIVAFGAATALLGPVGALLVAGTVGAISKVGIKAGDALTGGREYSGKDLLYDGVTGGINGLLGPITNGIGNTVTKTIATKFGISVLKEGAQEVAEQGIKQGFKQFAKSVVLNQSDDIIGGTLKQRMLAFGAGMAADGSLGGAADNMVRATFEGEDILKAGAEGFFGGLFMAPIVGGGMKLAGKAGRALNNKITTLRVLPDGLNTNFRQGATGDCALLSTLDGVMANPNTANKIKNSITRTAFGDYDVKIGDRIIRISKDALSDEVLSDTTGIKLFEVAYKQMGGSIDGEFAEVVAKQFGLNPIHITSESITDELLERISKDSDNLVLSLGADGHYYSIQGIDPQTKMVTLVDPYDTSKTLKMSFDEVKAKAASIDGGSVVETDLPNAARGADEVGLRGGIRSRSDKETSKIIELLLQNDKIRNIYDETNIQILIDDLDRGVKTPLISPEEYQRIRISAYTSSFPKQTIEIGGRKIYLTPKQQELYDKIMKQKLTPQNISRSYCGQVIMSDAMFIEATAVNLGMDIRGKSTSEIFDEISEKFLADEDVFPGITIQNKDEIADAFFGRSKHTDPIRSVGTMGGDKAVHELNKALMGLFEENQTFQRDWIEYCANSSKFKQLSALADTYKIQLREILGEHVSSKKVEELIKDSIENEDHIIFRALQRDAFVDIDNNPMVMWSEIKTTSFVEILAEKILARDVSESFFGGLLTRYKNKIDTIVYNFKNWNWETDGVYLPQFAS